jgi:hypothetical protein
MILFTVTALVTYSAIDNDLISDVGHTYNFTQGLHKSVSLCIVIIQLFCIVLHKGSQKWQVSGVQNYNVFVRTYLRMNNSGGERRIILINNRRQWQLFSYVFFL